MIFFENVLIIKKITHIKISGYFEYHGCGLVNIFGGLDDGLNVEIAESASSKTLIIFQY